MATNKTFIELGFVEDKNNLLLESVFQNNTRLKEVYIDIYPNNPMVSSDDFSLLLRTHDNNVSLKNDGNRLVLKRCDKHETYIMNILLSNVTKCFIKGDANYCEVILNVQNIYYKINIIN